MLVKERMSKQLITISKDDNINKAIDIMTNHGLHRLPVVENGKLIGLLTEGMISQKGASKATSLSIFELNYLLSKTNVSTIMERNVITIGENDWLEDAALKMLQYNIGCLPVVDAENKVVGILTQNDMFKSFIDLLGYNDIGSRVCIQVEDGLGVLEKVTKLFSDNACNITHIGVYGEENGKKNIIIRTDAGETKALEENLKEKGYTILSVTNHSVK